MNAFQLPVYYYDRDIFLFAAQLLDLIMFLVCVEEASQMQVKMLRTNQSQKLNKYKIKSQLLQRKISAFIITSNIQKWFLSCLLPLCQSDSLCKPIHLKLFSPYGFIFMQIKLMLIWQVFYEDCFETEEVANSEITYCLISDTCTSR